MLVVVRKRAMVQPLGGRVEVLALVLAACGPDLVPGGGGGASGSGSDTGELPGPLCPSLGLAPDEPLLVATGGDRAVIVQADGSIRELDSNPTEAIDDGPWVAFAVSSGAIATSSEWQDHVRLSLFTPAGDLLWATELEGEGLNPILAIHVTPDGIVAFNTYHDVWTVRDGEATRYEGFDLLAVPQHSRMAVARTEDSGWVEVGWIDLDTGEFSPAPVFGDVTAYGDLMVGVHCVDDGSRIYVATPDGVLADLYIGGYCLHERSVDGSSIRLFPLELPEAVAIVDLDDMSSTLLPIVPPEGYAHTHCGSPSFDEDGISVVLSNGTQLSQHRLAGGKWEPTLADPLSDTNGATQGSRSGSFMLRSWRHSQCEDDPLLPAVEGTQRGHSLQLWRPASNMKLAWDELEQRAFGQLGADGRCAVWSADEEPVVVVDMETGAYEALELPTGSSFRFAGTNESSVGWAYGL